MAFTLCIIANNQLQEISGFRNTGTLERWCKKHNIEDGFLYNDEDPQRLHYPLDKVSICLSDFPDPPAHGVNN